MEWLRFGTLAIESLSSTILLMAITIYLISVKQKTADGRFFTGYLGFLLVLHLSYTVRYSVFAPGSMAVSQFANLIVFGLLCFIQFAYHYGGCSNRKEANLAFLVTGVAAVAVWLSLFFEKEAEKLYDFSAQFYFVSYSPKVSIFVFVCYLWGTMVLIRKIVFFSRQEAADENVSLSRRKSLRRPFGRLALSARSFSYLGIAYATVSILYILFQFDVMSRGGFFVVFNTASLLICLVIFIVYINNSTRPVSVMAKLIGIPLAVITVAFGIASNALMPLVNSTLGDRYRDDVTLAQIILDSGGPGLVPSSIAFMLPQGNDHRKMAFMGADIRPEWADTIADPQTQWHEGLIPEKQSLKPSFIYLDLYDTESYFFAYTIESRNTPYYIGFRYNRYRLEVHRFALRLLLAAVAATAVVVLIFPVAYQRALLQPLGRLLKAVRQVASGNYGVRLPVLVKDEMGQLAEGYNDMALSLENAEGNFKALAENAYDAILILSTEGQVLFGNRRASDISGYTGDQIRSLHLSTLLPAASSREALVSKFESDKDIENRAHESVLLHRSGGEVPIEISLADTVWQGNPATVAVIRDISERKQVAEAIESQQQQLMRSDKLASIGALVAGMAHEINNPNQAISMNFRFFRDGLSTLFTLSESEEVADESVRIAGMPYDDFKETATAALAEIEASTRRIDHIVTELKRFVRGGVSARYEPTDVNQVIRVVADLSRHLINRSTNNFVLDLSPDLPTIQADRIGLEQVVLNLLQNACHSLENRESGVKIRTSVNEKSLLIEVIDQGRGIRKEDMPKITETFFTTKTETGGTGLGLTVSARIVREHSGSLTFESEPGSGTTVRVQLPLAG